MTVYLLDANILISLAVTDHPHHERAIRWAQDVEQFAVCPIVEGALIRLIVRMGAPVEDAKESLRHLRNRRGFAFWADSLSYSEAELDHVRGHRQVTDAYLASLAGSRPDARLATLDEGLAEALPALTFLIPDIPVSTGDK